MSLAEYNWTITTKPASEEWNLGEYKILNDGSGGGTFAAGSSQATMVYICEYNYFEKFLDTVLGKTVKYGASLRRSAASPTFDGTEGSTPEEHPYLYNFFASSAEVTPMGQPENVDEYPLWKKAKITVVFRPNDYNIVSDATYATFTDPHEYNRFTSKKTEGVAESQTTIGFFKLVGDPNHRQLDNTPVFVVPYRRLTYTWRQIPVDTDANGQPDLGKVPNIDTIQTLIGTLNITELDGYAPGTALFENWTPELVMPQVASANNYYWNINYHFGVRDYGPSSTPYVPDENCGWNYVFDPLRNVWDLYTSTGALGGNTQYKYTELNNLFAVAW